MKRASLQGWLLCMACAALTLGSVEGVVHQNVLASSQPPVSGDVSLLPQNSGVDVTPLSADVTVVSGDAALQSAESAWNIPSAVVDPVAGVVRGSVSIQGDPMHQNIAAWVVTADYVTVAPVTGKTYDKLCIVIDATSGQYVFAYPA